MLDFSFTDENLAKANDAIAKYPLGKQKSAVMELLWIAQYQNQNWLPKTAIEYVANLLEMPPVKVYEVATFYTMYNLKPIGKYLVQICGTTPCALRGSQDIIDVCKKEYGADLNETSKDGLFTLKEVECLGACSNAPMVQINDLYYEDLTGDSIKSIIDSLKSGKLPEHGSQMGRSSAESENYNPNE